MPITTPPTAPSRTDPTTFPDRADAWVAWQETSLVPQINALEANINAREASAVAASNSAAAASNAAAAVANATLWVSGTSYTLGQAVFDPVNFLTYRRAVAGAGTTRPGLDAVNWVQVAGTGNVSTTGDQTIGGIKTFSSPIVSGAGRYTMHSASLAMYEMHLVGQVARAWRLQANGTVDLVMTDGQGVVGSTLLSVTTAGHLTAAGNITSTGGQFIGNVTGNVTGNAGTVTNGVYTTGDQTIGGVKTFSSAPVVPDDAFTFAKLQNIATATILGRSAAGTGDVEALTGAQVTALLSGSLPVAVDVPAARLSGTVATARLGAGTADNTTFLRGDNTWQTISVTPSTAAVLNATAGAGANGVGTYALMREAGGNPISPGATSAGSRLEFATASAASSGVLGAGTWRCMGFVAAVAAGSGTTTLWLRIS